MGSHRGRRPRRVGRAGQLSDRLRVIFCGTAGFAVPSLQALHEHHDVIAAITQPARAGSRGRPAPRPVGDAAAALGIPVQQPERIRAAESVAAITALQPDALVVAAYGQIIPIALLELPRFGGINVHGSLLPRWRGAAPVAAAIAAGDAKTGVSIMQMDAGLDTGAVFAERAIPIAADSTTPQLTAVLAELGAELLIEVLAAVGDGTARATPQDGDAATYAPRLSREDGVVDWSATDAVAVDRLVRALQPWPGVTAPLRGHQVRLLAGAPVDAEGEPGAVVEARGESAVVATREGGYRIDQLQPAGRRPMSAGAFLRGLRS